MALRDDQLDRHRRGYLNLLPIPILHPGALEAVSEK